MFFSTRTRHKFEAQEISFVFSEPTVRIYVTAVQRLPVGLFVLQRSAGDMQDEIVKLSPSCLLHKTLGRRLMYTGLVEKINNVAAFR
jgi:hypothetical protein